MKAEGCAVCSARMSSLLRMLTWQLQSKAFPPQLTPGAQTTPLDSAQREMGERKAERQARNAAVSVS